VCHSCGKKGHFAKLCRSKPQNETIGTILADVHNVRNTKNQSPIKVEIRINGQPHFTEFDTGCQRSILSEDFWCHSLGRPRLEPCSISFRTYTNETFTPIGQCKVELEYQNQKVHHTFPVVKGNSLIGRDLMSSIKFNWNDVAQQCHLVKQNITLSLKTLLREYSEIFKPPT